MSGKASWDSRAYATKVESVYRSASREEVFISRNLDANLDPKNMKNGRRECRNSPTYPQATPISIFCDITGSMGDLSHSIIKRGLGAIMDGLLEKKPVSDPSVLFGAVGDLSCDRAPFQIGQFEHDNTLEQWITKIFIEQGGGDFPESYHAAWYWAARHVDADAFASGRKGFLFTIGDATCRPVLRASEVNDHIWPDSAFSDMKSDEILKECQKNWHVFHLVVKEPLHPQWTNLLGQHAIRVDDWNYLGEVIVSAIRMIAGESVDVVASTYKGEAGLVVASSLKHLSVPKSPFNGVAVV